MKNSHLLERTPESGKRGGGTASPPDPAKAKATVASGRPRHPPGESEREMSSVIDTSKMSQAQRDALELTEAARGAGYRSFAGDLFMGRIALDHVYPFPLQPADDVEA